MDSIRQTRIQEMLSQNNVGAFIGWRPDELVLMTGYYPQWGVSFCLYPREGQPILFNPALEPDDRNPDGLDVRSYPWGKVADPWTALIEQMRHALRERGLYDEAVSFVPNAVRSSTGINSAEGAPLDPQIAERLAKLTPAGWTDTSAAFDELYLRKTPVELERIRLAHYVATIALEVFYQNLVADMSEAELASVVESAVQNQMAFRDDVKFARGWAFIQSGPNSVYGGTYSRTTGRRMQPGELVMIEFAVCVNGYWADVTRTGVVRGAPPSPRHKEVFEVVKTAQELAVAAVIPGASSLAVDKVARDYIAAHGYGRFYEHHLGHHVGFRYHDPGPSLAPGSDFTLQPGMIVTIEPGAYGAELGAGCRVEDNVFVGESGGEVLSMASKALDGS